MKKTTAALLLAAALACGLFAASGCASWEGIKSDTARLFPGLYKECPFCGEMISQKAIVCPKCKRDLPAY